MNRADRSASRERGSVEGRSRLSSRSERSREVARGAPLLTAALLIALLAALLPVRGQDAPAPAPSPHAAISRTLARAVARAAPALVRIGPLVEGAVDARRARSGVIIASDLVLTSADNVETFGVDDLAVETADGRVLPARLRGRDLRLRAVLLQVEGLDGQPLEAAPALEAGALVAALGTGLRQLTLPTVTFGILSARGRFQGRAHQTDAPLDASNAGGALVDLEGRLVGILVRVDERLGARSGVGFAVPIDRVLPVLERLSRGEQLEPGRMGLEVPRVAAGSGPGTELAEVDPEGPGAAAGLRRGDRVLSLGGRATPHLRAFREAASFLYAGQRVEVEFLREGHRRTVTVQVLPL